MPSAWPELVTELWESVNNRLGRVNPVVLICGSVAGTLIVLRVRRQWRASDRPLGRRLAAYAFSWLRRLPSVRRRIAAELASTRLALEESIHECDESRDFITRIPASSMHFDELAAKADEYLSMNRRFRVGEGRVSGTVYTDSSDERHMALLEEVFRNYAFSNPLHPDVFPGCRKMEAEVVRMVAELFHAPVGSGGTMTSGGTESIILVCLASRNLAKSRGIDDPELLVSVTAHAAFDKAAHLLGMRIRHVPVLDESMEVDYRAMESAISDETCLLVGSAPNFPFGCIDNIAAIADAGLRHNIPVHVDACLGGFLIAFAEEAGVGGRLPLFDFRLPGVTSISCDTHKYGYAPKGTSTIIYRSTDYLHHQYFCVPEWPGGIYATPTLAGSRAGLNIALTWATLLHFGREEYVRRTAEILKWTRVLANALGKMPGLRVVGRVDASVCAFTTANSGCNIYAVSDELNKRGWNLNTLQMPDSIHFCLTYNQAQQGVVEAFLHDLQQAYECVSGCEDGGRSSGTAAIYGMAAQVPDKTLVDEVAFAYLDSCYSMPSRRVE